MQISTGIRNVLSHPFIYNSFQNLMGAKKGWKIIINQYLRPVPGDKILDIGCGPADVLQYLPVGVDYWGFDVSADYIGTAKRKYSDCGHFFAKQLTQEDLVNMPQFDTVLMSGVLHHLDDDVAKNLLQLAHDSLKSGGKLISVDPCYIKYQNPIARFLISKDRGQNVRNQTGYENLVDSIFPKLLITVRHKVWIPYTYCYMECKRA